jgi:hypothetical protein
LPPWKSRRAAPSCDGRVVDPVASDRSVAGFGAGLALLAA